MQEDKSESITAAFAKLQREFYNLQLNKRALYDDFTRSSKRFNNILSKLKSEKSFFVEKLKSSSYENFHPNLDFSLQKSSKSNMKTVDLSKEIQKKKDFVLSSSVRAIEPNSQSKVFQLRKREKIYQEKVSENLKEVQKLRDSFS